MFKKILLIMSLLFIGNFSFASECLKDGDLSDDRLIEYFSELSENKITLKEFVVYGYSARITSYWNGYYRHGEYKLLSDYPPMPTLNYILEKYNS